MRPGIERHRPRAALGLKRLDHRKFFRCVFMRNSDRSLAAGAEGVLSSRVKGIGVNALWDFVFMQEILFKVWPEDMRSERSQSRR